MAKGKAKQQDTTGLDLRINGVGYSVKLVPPVQIEDEDVARCLILTKRGPDGTKTDTQYECSETMWGNTCTCGDWTFRRAENDPKGCKHIKALVVWGLMSEASETLASSTRDWPAEADSVWSLTPVGMTGIQADETLAAGYEITDDCPF